MAAFRCSMVLFPVSTVVTALSDDTRVARFGASWQARVGGELGALLSSCLARLAGTDRRSPLLPARWLGFARAGSARPGDPALLSGR